MEEKQKTLRPEIQLLNNLMAATTVPERERVSFHCPPFHADFALTLAYAPLPYTDTVNTCDTLAFTDCAHCALRFHPCSQCYHLLCTLMATLEWPPAQFVQVLDDEEAKKALVMNNGYFFGLLDRMISG